MPPITTESVKANKDGDTVSTVALKTFSSTLPGLGNVTVGDPVVVPRGYAQHLADNGLIPPLEPVGKSPTATAAPARSPSSPPAPPSPRPTAAPSETPESPPSASIPPMPSARRRPSSTPATDDGGANTSANSTPPKAKAKAKAKAKSKARSGGQRTRKRRSGSGSTTSTSGTDEA